MEIRQRISVFNKTIPKRLLLPYNNSTTYTELQAYQNSREDFLISIRI